MPEKQFPEKTATQSYWLRNCWGTVSRTCDTLIGGEYAALGLRNIPNFVGNLSDANLAGTVAENPIEIRMLLFVS